jgi:O-antigen/teichoic acid export membrane protein
MSILKRISQSQLVRGSFLIFLANNAASFGNFLYNLSMGRLLTPDAFGDLGAILSILVLLSVPLSVFQLLIVKIVSAYWGGNKTGSINLLLRSLTPKLFLIGFLITGMMVLISPRLSIFLKLDNTIPLIVVSLFFILSVSTAFNKAILQGTLSFSYLATNGFIEVILKLMVAIVLAILNFGLIGALMGPLLGNIGGYLLTVFQIRILLKNDTIEKDSRKPNWLVLKTTLPVLLTTLTVTLFITADIILVKHFFPDSIAGEYMALSTVGKIIFYAVGPIISVMFPLISSRAESGTPYILPLLGTLVMALGISSILIFIYFLFPGLILGILYGSKYNGAIPYMGIFSFFVTLFTINSILTHFLLSVSYYRPIYILFVISLFQSIFIFFIHNSITSVIWINIFVSLLYLFIVSFFVWQKEKVLLKRILIQNILKNVI